ncbi:MAG: SDR family NAD(P)-dependent oxidoreductase [Anaerolineaceae bacterium]|nr:SDR family NAD(P)-dependent oxidoreductase [Anaerolineaceae bacterium]
MGRLAGKRAIVTGGAQGLGRATALRFAEEGAQLLVTDVKADAVMAVAGEIRAAGGMAHALQADVSAAEDAERTVAAAVEHLGGLDVLVNNAGVMGYGTVAAATDADWQRIIGINLHGVFLCSRAAIPVMAQGGGGSIVCISSISGLLAQPNQAIYNASKHGVIGLVRCMALDHAAEGIRVNAVCPGMMLTPMLTHLPEEQLAGYAQANMLKRGGDPAEVAQLVLFLASDEASYVTGAVIPADGGESAK